MRIDLKNPIRKVLPTHKTAYRLLEKIAIINGASSALCLCIITQLLP